MQGELTLKQEEFVAEYIATGSGSAAAKKVYDVTTDDAARAMASQNFRHPKVREKIDKVRAKLQKIAFKSVKNIETLGDTAKSEYVRLEANKDILNRAGYTPPTVVNDNRSLTINISEGSAARFGLLKTPNEEK